MHIAQNKPLWLAVLLSLMILLLSSCAEQNLVRGQILRQSQLDMVEEGKSTTQDVLQALGTPTTAGQFNQNRWLYIGQKRIRNGFVPPKMQDIETYVLDFDNRGVLQKITYYSSDDLQLLSYNDERTLTRGSQLTVMQQLLGNLGRFEADQNAAGGVRDLLER